mmetsp:Transcript_86528/g.220500  ORF Transcript_86528/g.220500 Transcript_86528/m.220500 type:complete len:263 (-) Transcript_86528:225-1013(-)
MDGAGFGVHQLSVLLLHIVEAGTVVPPADRAVDRVGVVLGGAGVQEAQQALQRVGVQIGHLDAALLGLAHARGEHHGEDRRTSCENAAMSSELLALGGQHDVGGNGRLQQRAEIPRQGLRPRRQCRVRRQGRRRHGQASASSVRQLRREVYAQPQRAIRQKALPAKVLKCFELPTLRGVWPESQWVSGRGTREVVTWEGPPVGQKELYGALACDNAGRAVAAAHKDAKPSLPVSAHAVREDVHGEFKWRKGQQLLPDEMSVG